LAPSRCPRRPPPRRPLFPYATLFRSGHVWLVGRGHVQAHLEPWLAGRGYRVTTIGARAWMRGEEPAPEAPPDAIFITISAAGERSEEHTSELQSRENLVCRLLLEKKK